jgi:hypothetical protein
VRQPGDAAKSAGALSVLHLSHSTGVPAGCSGALGHRACGARDEPQFGVGVMYDILVLALAQRRL